MLSSLSRSRTFTLAARLIPFALALVLLPIVGCQNAQRIMLVGLERDEGGAFVMGAIAKKRRTLDPGTTVFQAITTADVSSDADLTRIVLFRPDEESPLRLVINVREMIMTGNMTTNAVLESNDIVYVPRTGEPLPTFDTEFVKLE